jgi:hypothetical protein
MKDRKVLMDRISLTLPVINNAWKELIFTLAHKRYFPVKDDRPSGTVSHTNQREFRFTTTEEFAP